MTSVSSKKTVVTRIEVFSKVLDTRAKVRKNKLQSFLALSKIKKVWISDIYTIEAQLSLPQIRQVAASLTNPLTQKTFINKNNSDVKFNWALEIGFLPGVTDNVGNTAKEIIEDLLKIKFKLDEGVYTSQLTFIKGDLSKEDVKKIAESLANPLIQRIYIKSFTQFQKDKGMDKIVPKVKLEKKPEVLEVDLNVSDEELTLIGKAGIQNDDGIRRGPLALDLSSMKAIQKYFKKFGRNPTDIELEALAQTWSEHCKHTIFSNPLDDIKKGLFKTYIKASTEKIRKKIKKDFCVSVFSDNSGAIIFDKNYLITHKVETHNSPSALDPFGGSVTGIVGVNRDTIGFGLGAKPICNTYGFCFSYPEENSTLYRDQNLTQKMLSPRRIIDGVVDGVNYGGNCSGIPTPQGFVYFDKRYQGKPLVFVGTVGLIPKKINGKFSHLKKAQPGDYIVMIGGRVGLDGIHGATFSSEALDSGSPATAVQIGDPITQKKLSDAVVKEARQLSLYNSITDNGAGGLSSSVAEMAKESGGCRVFLDKVPLKYPGLNPWQIWISESQERMTLAVPKRKWPKFASLMKKRGVEATIIGKFKNSGKCEVFSGQKKIVNLSMEFLHDGLPKKQLTTQKPNNHFTDPKFTEPKDLNKIFLKLLVRHNISSFEYISGQYDHEVQGSAILKPLQGKGRINSETSIIKPVLNSQKGVALSQALYPSFSEIDSYNMAACAIDTAIRNLVVVGADPNYIALLDNFCWCSSQDPERLYQLKEALRACYDYSVAFGTPLISGKDSMFNDFKGFDEKGRPLKISVPPTLLISSIGIIPEITKAVSLDIKLPGDLVYLLGETFEELGGSEYLSLLKEEGNTVPKVDALKNKKLYQSFYTANQKNLLSSAISIGRGGLAVALSKATMAGMLGVEFYLKNLPGKVRRDDYALFSESQGRILVTVAPENKKDFEKIMRGKTFSQVGVVTDKNLIAIKGLKNNLIVQLKVTRALEYYQSTFKDY